MDTLKQFHYNLLPYFVQFPLLYLLEQWFLCDNELLTEMGSINMLIAADGIARRFCGAEGVRFAAVPPALPEPVAERQGDRHGASVQLGCLAVSTLLNV